jgi:hypothetical protein
MVRAVDDLLTVLGRERHVLDNLVFRLVEARGLLLTGESRFLHLAARDVEAATEAVREVELTRAIVEPCDPSTTLREMATAAASPLDAILDDHRAAIGRIAAEVGAAIEAITELAEHALATLRTRELVAAGGSSRSRPRAPLDELDREIMASGYEAVLHATARLTLPSLVAFLG